MKRPTKVIIPVAGYGTRRLPVAKAIEKCMLPICNRPIVDYTVEECVLNGITDIYFIVSDDAAQLRTYYGHNQQLEDYLQSRGKTEALASVQAIATEATFHYIVQDLDGPYGTAVPVWLAREAVQDDEQFVVMTGDDFMFNPDEPGANLRRVFETLEASGASSAILAAELEAKDIGRYASIKPKIGEGGREYFDDMIEKPTPGEVLGNLANISKYVFEQKIFDYLTDVMKAPNKHGEHFLTDAVNAYAADGHAIALTRSVGQYLDGGNLASWIEANNVVFATLSKA